MIRARTKEWVRQVPAGWRDGRLKDFFSYAKGLNITKADLVEDGVAVVSYGQIHAKHNTGTHLDQSLIRYVPEEIAVACPNSKLKEGDIVFADTSEDLDGVGNCVLNDSGDEVYAGYHALIARARFPEHSKYLSYLFQTDAWRGQVRTRASGIKVFSLTQRVLNPVTVILPPLPEQKRIAAFLDAKCADIDKAIETKRKQLDLLEVQWKNEITRQVVFGGVGLRQSTNIVWMPEIKRGWRTVSLKRLLKTKLEYGLSEAAELEDRELPRYIRITDFDENGALKDETFRSLPVDIAKDAMLQVDDVLFARSGATVGKSFIYEGWDRGACFAGYLIRAQTKPWLLDPHYLYYFTKSLSYDAWKNLIFTQATIQNISAVKYGMMKLPVPPIGEQKDIVKRLNERHLHMERLFDNLRRQIEVLSDYRKSLIHECVMGERRVG